MDEYMMDSMAAARLELTDEIAWERAKHREELQDARYDAEQRVDRVMRSFVPAAEWMLIAAGAAFTLSGVALFLRDLTLAGCCLATVFVMRWVSRKIREDWRDFDATEGDA